MLNLTFQATFNNPNPYKEICGKKGVFSLVLTLWLRFL